MFSGRLLRHFVEAIASELGGENFSSILEKAGLPPDWSESAHWDSMKGAATVEAYAGIQKAIRTYYGRGARGILTRVGNNLWNRLLGDAPLATKAQSKVVFRLPVNARRRSALELLAKLLTDQRGDVTVHTLDQDLLLVDKASPSTLGQSESECICYVTLGLLRECLHWATGQQYDVEEISCRATGKDTCEFKITTAE